MNAAILGAGNGGLSIGAYLALRGWDVSLFDAFESQLSAVRNSGGVSLTGSSMNGFAKFKEITTDLGKALFGCPLIMITTPAFAHRELAEKCAPFLCRGQTVVLNPGRTGGAMEFRHRVLEINPEADFVSAESQTLIYACRKTGPAEAKIYSVKEKVPLAAFPSSDTLKAIDALNSVYPQFEAASNILETGMMNMGAIFHPAPAILNIARIESKEVFDHYTDGITPCVGEVLEQVDKERVAIAEALEVPTLSCRNWLGMAYGIKIEPEDTIRSALRKNEAYKGIRAPSDPYARYITEDVPMSLVPLSELGRIAGVPTPCMDTLITLAGFLHKTDYREKGRTAEKLGIKGLSLEKLKEYVVTGRK